MQQQFATSASQWVVCASRSRLRPVSSLLSAPKGAPRFGRCRQKQRQGAASWVKSYAFARLPRTARVQGFRASGITNPSASVGSQSTAGTVSRMNERCAFGWLPKVSCSVAQSRVFGPVGFATVAPARPNPSVKLSTNGGPPGPGRQYGVHFCRPGPGVPPLAPAYLER
jgi:hypothetical protein